MKDRVGVFELGQKNLIEAAVTINVKVVHPPLQVHRKQQTRQAKVMIAMKMAYENMIDLMIRELIPLQLHLRSFTRIHQEEPVLNFNELRGGKSSVGRKRAAGTEDGDFEGQWLI